MQHFRAWFQVATGLGWSNPELTTCSISGHDCSVVMHIRISHFKTNPKPPEPLDLFLDFSVKRKPQTLESLNLIEPRSAPSGPRAYSYNPVLSLEASRELGTLKLFIGELEGFFRRDLDLFEAVHRIRSHKSFRSCPAVGICNHHP